MEDIPVNSPFICASFKFKNNDLIRDESEKYSTTFYGENLFHLLKAEVLEHNFIQKSHKTGLKLINNFIMSSMNYRGYLCTII